MKYWLIKCRYEYWCQGYEWTTDTFLVKGKTFKAACEVLKVSKKNAECFENMTID
jgi:hypothetical protein